MLNQPNKKKESTDIDAELAALKAKIEAAKKAVFQKQNDLQTAVKSLNAANSAVTATSSKMNRIDLANQNKDKPNEDQMKMFKHELDSLTDTVNESFATLNKEIPSKVADLNNSKKAFFASDFTKFRDLLATSYPN